MSLPNFNSPYTSFKYNEKLEKIKIFLLKFLRFKNASSFENSVLDIKEGFVSFRKGDVFPISSISSVSISKAPKIKYPLGLLELALLKILLGDILTGILGFSMINSISYSLGGSRSFFSELILVLFVLFIIAGIGLYIIIAVLNFFRGTCLQFALISGKTYCIVTRNISYIRKSLELAKQAIEENKDATFDFSNSTISGSVIGSEGVITVNNEEGDKFHG